MVFFIEFCKYFVSKHAITYNPTNCEHDVLELIKPPIRELCNKKTNK